MIFSRCLEDILKTYRIKRSERGIKQDEVEIDVNRGIINVTSSLEIKNVQ